MGQHSSMYMIQVLHQHKDQFISNNLRDRFALAAHPLPAMQLVSSSKTRLRLVTRIINQIIAEMGPSVQRRVPTLNGLWSTWKYKLEVLMSLKAILARR